MRTLCGVFSWMLCEGRSVDDLWVVLPHLGAGGAQKVGLLAAEYFSASGYRVKVLTLMNGHPILHTIPDGVTHIELGPEANFHPWLRDGDNRSWIALGRRFVVVQTLNTYCWLLQIKLLMFRSWFDKEILPESDNFASSLFMYSANILGGARLYHLRCLIEKARPKRVLALLTKTNILCCLSTWDLPIHLVVSERNDPALQKLSPAWSLLRRVCYRRADVVTANTQGVIQALQEMGHWRRLALLPNPLPIRPVLKGQAVELDQRQREILALARLQPQKGLDLLLRAFASLAISSRRGWKLTLVGDGPESVALKNLAQSLGIEEVVSFEGFRPDPQTFFRRASIFALPSRFEGMPNALLEAMASGLPSVISDASPGPLEMVRDGVEGLVVPSENIEALSCALERLINDPSLRQRCGSAARTTLASLDWSVLEPRWRSVLALPKDE